MASVTEVSGQAATRLMEKIRYYGPSLGVGGQEVDDVFDFVDNGRVIGPVDAVRLVESKEATWNEFAREVAMGLR